MKKIEAIIRPECLGIVRKALEELSYPGLTVTEVKGHGKQEQIIQRWRGQEYRVDLLPKIKIEIAVIDEDVDRIVNAITRTVRTGEPGDGKIFILPVEGAVRIRTGDRDKDAI